MSAQHTPGPWRLEWHECGWSSRWLVVRGDWRVGTYQVLDGGYTAEADARAAIAKATGSAS